MKLTEKNFNIGGQILITLFFFAGMLLNFFLLYPIIDQEETERIRADIDRYCLKFYPYDGFDIKNEALRDSLTNAVPRPYGGDVIISDCHFNVLYSNIECTPGENIISLVSRSFGPTALKILEEEYASEDKKSVLVYEKGTRTSYFSRYEPAHDLLFFLTVDYNVAGSRMISAYRFLLLFMTLGGVTVIVISYFDVRRMGKKLKNEAEAQKDLDMASRIQQAMLPDGEKHLMQVDIDAKIIPARKVGGDFFCYLLREGVLYFCIGDVSGKGVPASLFMSKAVTLFRSFVNLSLTPVQITSRMNDELCIHNFQNMFITSIVGSMDVTDGTIVLVNSGHEAPVIWDGDPASSPALMKTTGNIPLGVMPSQEYSEDTMVLNKNGLMFFYTDGVTEAKSQKSGLMGRSSLLSILDEVKDLSSSDINDHILSRVKQFEKGVEQSDDITMMTFRNIEKPKTLKLKNEVKDLRKVVPFLDGIFRECPLDSKSRIRVRSGLDEALTNCVHYAYEGRSGEIEVKSELVNGSLVFTVTDEGKEFNPLTHNQEFSSELKVGGLGIAMMKSSFDDLNYRRIDGRNILTLVKKL